MLVDIEIPNNAPSTLKAIIASEFQKHIDQTPTLLTSLPEDAPDLDTTGTAGTRNLKLRNYLKKNRLHAFRVTLRITNYDSTVTDDFPKNGHILRSQLRIHMLGETLPAHTMGFSGDGSADLRIEVGQKIRPRDRQFADTQAATSAITQAVSASLRTLPHKARPPRSKRKRR